MCLHAKSPERSSRAESTGSPVLRLAHLVPPTGLTAFREGLAIAQRLALADPSNTQWQRDLFISHANLGLVAAQTNDPAAARDHFTRARAIIEPLTRKDPTNAQWRQDLAWLDDQIRTLK